jgi:hypothetical protein
MKWSFVSVFMMAATACGGGRAKQESGEQMGNTKEAITPTAGVYRLQARPYAVNKDGEKAVLWGSGSNSVGVYDVAGVAPTYVPTAGEPRGISGSGSVVVGQNTAPTAAFWTKAQGWVALPLPAPAHVITRAEPAVYDANDTGSKMVGFSTIDDSVTGHTRDVAVVWNQTTSGSGASTVVTPSTPSVLSPPAALGASAPCYAKAVMRYAAASSVGGVPVPVGAKTYAVVGDCYAPGLGYVAAMWTRTMQSDGTFSSWNAQTFTDPLNNNILPGVATSVSSKGDWVAGAIYDAGPSAPTSLFRWSAATGVQRLGKCTVPSNAGATSAYIKDDGSIVVGTFSGVAGAATCFWQGGGIQSLGHWIDTRFGAGTSTGLNLNAVSGMARAANVIIGGGVGVNPGAPWAISW